MAQQNQQVVSPQQIMDAARAGAELLSSNEVRVPGAQMNHLLLLREILVGVATGRLVIGVPQQQPGGKTDEPTAKTEDKNQAGGRAGRGSRR